MWCGLALAGLTLLWVCPGVRAEGKDEGEFAINLFSDLAPILALFGEKFATQFLSEAMDWPDYLIFAMVPLGIVTATTAAIRVQGPAIARQFIGLARENKASAEIEIMSSTSHEVCELYNGKGVVRAMGRADIKQILVFPARYNKVKEHLNKEDAKITEFIDLKTKKEGAPGLQHYTCGIHTLATACGYHPDSTLGADILKDESVTERRALRGRVYHSYSYEMIAGFLARMAWKTWRQGRRRSQPSLAEHGSDPSEGEEVQSIKDNTSQNLGEKRALRRLGPPNLQLNHSRPFEGGKEWRGRLLYLTVVTMAIVLQLGLFAIAGVTAYHAKTKTAVGYEYLRYGFPCYAAGTACLSLGMAICAIVIGQSTDEWSWEPEAESRGRQTQPPPADESDAPLRLFWIQRAQSVNDQTFGAFAILEGPRQRIITSSRSTHSNGANDDEVDNHSSSTASAKKESKFWLWFRRYWWDARETFTVVGVLLAVAGFIVQFIGLRALPYPVSIAQLGSIIIMALLRALLRRNMSREFRSFEALAKYELDFLATKLTFDESFRTGEDGDAEDETARVRSNKPFKHHWRVLTASSKNKEKFYFVPTEQVRASTAAKTETKMNERTANDPKDWCTSQQLLRVRQRLGHITTWQSVASNAAIALSRSMAYFLDEFYPKTKNYKKPPEGETAHINLAIPVTRAASSTDSPARESVVVRFSWQGFAGWEADQGTLDAILSLWMAHIESSNAPGSQSSVIGADRNGAKLPGWLGSDARNPIYRYRRILGDDYGHGVLRRDLHWWVDGFNDNMLADTSRISQVPSDSKIVIGFNGLEERGGQELAVEGCLPLPLILAQHIFTRFIWDICGHLTRDCLGQGLPPKKQDVDITERDKFVPDEFDKTWVIPTLRDRGLSKLVYQIERTGLGDAIDIFFCIIPAFSVSDLLPNEAILQILPRKGPEMTWCDVAKCYTRLLESKMDLEKERFCYEAVVASVEFLLVAMEPFNESNSLTSKLREPLRDLVHLLTTFEGVWKMVYPIYHMQRRSENITQAFRELKPEAVVSYPTRLAFDEISKEGYIRKLGCSRGHIRAFQILQDSSINADDADVIVNDYDKQDIFGWTVAHYASLFEEEAMVRRGIKKPPRTKLLDKVGRSPLHLLARVQIKGKQERLKRILKDREAEDGNAHIFSQGLDGMTPLHLAVKSQCKFSFDALITGLEGPAVRTQDAWGREALHLAAMVANRDMCVQLLDARGSAEPPESKDHFGFTPLGYVFKGQSKKEFKAEMIDKIVRLQPLGISHRYENGQTALHLAAQHGTKETVEYMMTQFKKEVGKYLNMKEASGRIPLHLAILGRKPDTAKFLLRQELPKSKGHPGSWDEYVNTMDAYGLSPLALACNMGLKEVVQELLERFPTATERREKINTKGEKGKTLLHHTVDSLAPGAERQDGDETRQSQTITYLLDEKANVCALDDDKQTPLIVACRAGFSTAVETIVERVTQGKLEQNEEELEQMFNCADEEWDETALHWASELGNEDAVEHLLKAPAARKVTISTKLDNFTPLHCVIAYQYASSDYQRRKIVQMLCSAIPDLLDARDRQNSDILEFADRQVNPELGDEIIKHDKIKVEHIRKYLLSLVNDPSENRVRRLSKILQLVDSGNSDYGWLLPFRKEVAKLGRAELVARWTSMALKEMRAKGGITLSSGSSQNPNDIPFSFAVRGCRHATEAQDEGPDADANANADTKANIAKWAKTAVDTLLEIVKVRDGSFALGTSFTEPDDDGWSIRDWARRHGLDDEILNCLSESNRTIGEIYQATNHVRSGPTKWEFSNEVESMAGVELDDRGTASIKLTTESSSNIFLRANRCILPSTEEDFSFQVEFKNFPSGATVRAGFCGEFWPDAPVYPGSFYGSWAFEDLGRLYIDDHWDKCETAQKSRANGSPHVPPKFTTGDTVVFSVNPKSAKTWYNKRGSRFDPCGNDVVSLLDNETVKYGKLYPCVGIDGRAVGLEIVVSLGGSQPPEGRKGKKLKARETVE